MSSKGLASEMHDRAHAPAARGVAAAHRWPGAPFRIARSLGSFPAMSEQIDTLLHEHRRFPPVAAFAAQAQADRQRLTPLRPPTGCGSGRSCSGTRMDHALAHGARVAAPHARWFDGGTFNVSVNCLDRHVQRRETQISRR